MKRNKYKDRESTPDGFSFGEVMQQIGKQTTERIHVHKKQYKRKPKHKQNWLDNE